MIANPVMIASLQLGAQKTVLMPFLLISKKA